MSKYQVRAAKHFYIYLCAIVRNHYCGIECLIVKIDTFNNDLKDFEEKGTRIRNTHQIGFLCKKNKYKYVNSVFNTCLID